MTAMTAMKTDIRTICLGDFENSLAVAAGMISNAVISRIPTTFNATAITSGGHGRARGSNPACSRNGKRALGGMNTRRTIQPTMPATETTAAVAATAATRISVRSRPGAAPMDYFGNAIAEIADPA